jgi:hypothetical protein
MHNSVNSYGIWRTQTINESPQNPRVWGVNDFGQIVITDTYENVENEVRKNYRKWKNAVYTKLLNVSPKFWKNFIPIIFCCFSAYPDWGPERRMTHLQKTHGHKCNLMTSSKKSPVVITLSKIGLNHFVENQFVENMIN